MTQLLSHTIAHFTGPYFTLEKPSFSMYLLCTQEHTIPLCIKILQILFQLELSWFWIEGKGRF